ncbi:MAG: carbohydrate-binding domain-containing protein [Firmicutes bacterium]|nr:carbohydrate-binding domain-containing protein [[Eubacterium] siraeum]MCM1488833.1 carbohydrate-binding domain-containing protein [Bacillota bacterium]
MKKLKMIAAIISAAMACGILNGCQNSGDTENIFAGTAVNTEKIELSAEDSNPSYNADGAVKISLSGTSAEIDGKGAELKGGELTVSEGGEYLLEGSFSGTVTVDAGKNDVVKLILNNAEITTEDIAPLQILKAKKVYVILPENTSSSLVNGEDCEEGTADSALYSKSDLNLSGEGSLKITAHNSHGIGGKDNLIITGGSYEIQSDKTGIIGKDSLLITGGSFDITSGTNGIKSSNTELGSIDISGGSFKITSQGDSIQSEGNLTVSGGSFDITAGGGAGEIQNNGGDDFGGFGGNGMQGGGFGGNGMQGGGFGGNGMHGGCFGGGMRNGDGTDTLTPPNGDMSGENGDMPTPPTEGMGGENENMPTPPIGSMGGENGDMPDFPFGGMGGENGDIPAPPSGDTDGRGADMLDLADSGEFNKSSFSLTAASSSQTDSSVSQKAFKCGGLLTVSGGTINVSSADDCLHSAGQITISSGTLNLASGDDGIHSDSSVVISGGTLNISKSYEGIEGLTVDIMGGSVNVTASDDGINGAGGSDTGDENRWGRNEFAAQEGVYVRISGGEVVVNASGDGIDSNGDFYVTGGSTVVYGPTNNGNGALDYNGKATVSGGTFIAFGSSGMAQGFDSSSEQYSFLLNLSSSVKSGETVKITDGDGNVIFEGSAQKNWNSIVFTSEALAAKMTVNVEAGGVSESMVLNQKAFTSGAQYGFGR